jgi:hypothetical protein
MQTLPAWDKHLSVPKSGNDTSRDNQISDAAPELVATSNRNPSLILLRDKSPATAVARGARSRGHLFRSSIDEIATVPFPFSTSAGPVSIIAWLSLP